jgi:hypothetical protein
VAYVEVKFLFGSTNYIDLEIMQNEGKIRLKRGRKSIWNKERATFASKTRKLNGLKNKNNSPNLKSLR